MPEIQRFSHASFSLRDLTVSTSWYCDVLRFAVLKEMAGPHCKETVLVHPGGVVLSLQQHVANRGESLDPVRTGIDHLAVLVPGSEGLDAWDDELTPLEVEHSAPVERHYGTVLSLKDPDRIALELFWRDGHP
jgi:glyoxylase I family protein